MDNLISFLEASIHAGDTQKHLKDLCARYFKSIGQSVEGVLFLYSDGTKDPVFVSPNWTKNAWTNLVDGIDEELIGKALEAPLRFPFEGKRWSVAARKIDQSKLLVLIDNLSIDQTAQSLQELSVMVGLTNRLSGSKIAQNKKTLSSEMEFIDVLHDPLFILDQNLKIAHCNKKAREYFRLPLEEMIGHEFAGFIDPALRPVFIEKCHLTFSQEVKPFVVNFVICSVPFQGECMLIRRNLSRGDDYICIIREVGKERILEEMIRIKDKNLAILNDLSRGLSNLVDPDRIFDLILQKAFRDINIDYIMMIRADRDQTNFRVTNIHQKSEQRENVFELGDLAPDKPKKKEGNQVIDGQLVYSLERRKGNPDPGDWHRIGKNILAAILEKIEIHPVGSRVTIPLMMHNRLYGFMIFLNQDIRHRLDDPATYDFLMTVCQHMVTAIENSELLKRTIAVKNEWEASFDAITDFIRIQSLTFDIQRVNRHFASYFDLPREEIVGMKCYRLIYARDEICQNCPAVDTIDRKAIAFREFTYCHEDQEQYIACWTYPILDDYEKLSSIVVYSKDITKEQQLQQQLLQSEKMASIGQLVAGIAHEINTPLAYVNSNLEVMEEYLDGLKGFHKILLDQPYVLANKQAFDSLYAEHNTDYYINDMGDAMKDATEGVQRIKTIVKDLKNFTHTSSDEFEISDINEIIAGTLSLVRNELKYKVEIDRKFGDVPKIRCVPIQISQVLLNLFVNAAQAIEEQGAMEIETFAENHDLIIKVSDTGKGIPEHLLSKIFDPFFTTKDVGVGTGLGLSVSYEIIKRHGGDIFVESEIGKGTTFTIQLPITE